jgi:geranylgeranyl reductase family protein
MRDVDLAIVGAGPAGAAAALAALQVAPRARVVMIDRSDFPRDKACGDGIAGQAVDELALLGAGDAVAGYRPVTSLRLRGPHGASVAAPMPRRNWVVPRRVLDARLVVAAERAGARRVVHRVRRLAQRPEGVDIDGIMRAGGVVATDGANSTVRRLLGAPRNPDRHLAVAVRGYVDVDPDDEEQAIDLIGDGGWPAYHWRFPVGDGTANVGYGIYVDGMDGARSHLRARVVERWAPTEVRDLRAHRLPLSSHRPVAGRGRVLLAGDAASLINPLSGEGIFYAVLSGRLAAEALMAGPEEAVARYRRALRRRLGGHLLTTGVASRLLRSTSLVDAAVAAAGRRRRRFDELCDLALGDGTVSPRAVIDVLAELRGAKLRQSTR